jgi:transcriptional regulator with XRE-family HTH domain
MEKSIYSNDYALFLQHLRETRNKAGLTQEQLAELLGQTQSFISKVERGERRLDVVELRAFCNALGVSFPSFVAQFDKLLAKGRKGNERNRQES